MNNPELQRQIWLNWRASVVGWSLLLTALVLALPLVLSPERERMTNLGIIATLGLWIATCLYGSVLAGRSLSEELRDNTWDWQRLSAITPWRMAWGKLLGAALPAWLYAALFATVVLFVASPWEALTGQSLGWHTVAPALLWGLALQVWSMNASLLDWHTGRSAAGRRRHAFVLAALVIWLGFGVWTSYRDKHAIATIWWGWETDNLGLSYLAGVLALGLGLLAVWRQLCQRLDVATLPWAWPLGLALLGSFIAGLMGSTLVTWLKYVMLTALLASAFIALQHMARHARDWRQTSWCAQHGRWRNALQALPLWPVSWLMALLAALTLTALPTKYEDGWGGLLLCLQLLRDALLLTGFALLGKRYKSPMAVFVITWLAITLVLPLLVHGLGGDAASDALVPLRILLKPSDSWSPLSQPVAWTAMGVHLLLAAAWAARAFLLQGLSSNASGRSQERSERRAL
ncbi:MAG: hypothetical protein LC097_07290 [Burkholderiales bacterium]|nr:hypothetical protein [Burkholderiales bacterium]